MTYGPYCTYCVATRNATLSIQAIPVGGEPVPFESAPSPRRLIEWVATMQIKYSEFVRFEIGDRPDAFLQVATWHGDPVCTTHLWELAP